MGFEIRWEPRGVYRRYWGCLSAAEFADSQAVVFGDARFDDLRYAIVDFAEVTEFHSTLEEAEQLAAFNRAAALYHPAMRVAFVTTNERMVGLLRQVGAVSAYPLGVFANASDARLWVDGATAGAGGGPQRQRHE